LKLPSGREIPLSGKIDRVDVHPDGAIEIVDYKSGKLPRTETLVASGKDRIGVHLQLHLYAHAAATYFGKPVVRARFVATSGHAPLDAAELDAEALHAAHPRLGPLAERAIACVERGWFPSLPGSSCCTRGLGCVCGPLVTARMRGKRDDEELKVHLAALGVTLPGESDE
jgi:hypothetical protein